MTMKDFWNRRDRYGAPAVLVAVAITQLYLAHGRDLTPWKGGGFGMFSTVDAPKARLLRCYLLTDHGELPVAVPRALRRAADRLRAMPDAARAQRLAAALAAVAWVRDDFDGIDRAGVRLDLDALPATGEPAEASGPPSTLRALDEDERMPAVDERVGVTAVRVEVWRYRFALEPARLEIYQALAAAAPTMKGEV